MIDQIYAFIDPDTTAQAVQVGVDQIGFAAGEYSQAHGELSIAKARQIVTAPEGEVSAALTMSADIDEITRMAEAVQPRIIHISSDMHLVDMEKMSVLRSKLPAEIQLMKAIGIQDEDSIAAAEEFARVRVWLLLVSSHTGFPGVSETGMTHDWGISRRIVEAVSVPVILAGGISDWNVIEAIKGVQPMGVDSTTSTKLDGSRVEKDLNRIAAFVQTVRARESSIQISEDTPAVTVYGAGFSLPDHERVVRFLASLQADTFAGAFHPFMQKIHGVLLAGARL